MKTAWMDILAPNNHCFHFCSKFFFINIFKEFNNSHPVLGVVICRLVVDKAIYKKLSEAQRGVVIALLAQIVCLVWVTGEPVCYLPPLVACSVDDPESLH